MDQVTTDDGGRGLRGAPEDARDPEVWLLEGLSVESHRWIAHHRIAGEAVLPAAAYLELVATAAASALVGPPLVLEDVVFHRALFLLAHQSVDLKVTLEYEDAHRARIAVESRGTEDEPWIVRASAIAGRGEAVRTTDSLDHLRSRCRAVVDREAFYRHFSVRGMDYGKAFRGVSTIAVGGDEALADIALPVEAAADQEYLMNPALLDACLQTIGGALGTERTTTGQLATGLPVAVRRVQIHAPLGDLCAAHCKLVERRADWVEADVSVFDPAGRPVVEVLGVRVEAAALSAVQSQPLRDSLYEVAWEAWEAAGSARTAPSGTWLVFDDGALGSLLADRMPGATCTRVLVGPTYSGDGSCMRVRDDDPADMQRCVADACRGRDLEGLIFLWGLSADMGQEDASARLGRVLARVGDLVRSLHAARSSPRVWLVSRGAQAVAAGDRVMAEQATLWGFGRTFAQEHPSLWGGLMDLDPAASPDAAADAIVSSLGAAEDQVAFRNGRRFAARLTRTSLGPEPTGTFAARPDATYVVTGGLGGLGLEVARWLVAKGAKRLLLVARTPLPDRAAWAAAAAAGDSRGMSVLALELAGAIVDVAAADVSDGAALASVLRPFERAGAPPIRGAFHCAGVLRFDSIEEMNAAEVSTVLRPKLAARSVIEALGGAPLDFVVLFSSFTALVSSPRIAHYAAANAFLDALAHEQRAKGVPALSVNWGIWSEVGMAARTEVANRQAQSGLGSIAPSDGVALLEELLRRSGLAQIGVCRIDWEAWRKVFVSQLRAPYFSRVSAVDGPALATAAEARLRRSVLDAPPSQRDGLVADLLRGIVGRVLRIPTDHLQDRPILSLGLDSLTAVELKSNVQRDFGVVVPIDRLLKGLTIGALAAHIASELAPAEAAAGKPPEAAPDWIAELSDAQMDALFEAIDRQDGSRAPSGATDTQVRTAGIDD